MEQQLGNQGLHALAHWQSKEPKKAQKSPKELKRAQKSPKESKRVQKSPKEPSWPATKYVERPSHAKCQIEKPFGKKSKI